MAGLGWETSQPALSSAFSSEGVEVNLKAMQEAFSSLESHDLAPLADAIAHVLASRPAGWQLSASSIAYSDDAAKTNAWKLFTDMLELHVGVTIETARYAKRFHEAFQKLTGTRAQIANHEKSSREAYLQIYRNLCTMFGVETLNGTAGPATSPQAGCYGHGEKLSKGFSP